MTSLYSSNHLAMTTVSAIDASTTITSQQNGHQQQQPYSRFPLSGRHCRYWLVLLSALTMVLTSAESFINTNVLSRPAVAFNLPVSQKYTYKSLPFVRGGSTYMASSSSSATTFRSNNPSNSSSSTTTDYATSDHCAVNDEISESMYRTKELVFQDPANSTGPLNILFLSADTGGGHRASAESLAQQFLEHYPGSKYDLLDVWTTDGVYPYKTLVKSYQHLSAHPRQWQILYHLSNSKPWEIMTDIHSTLMCERRIRKRIASYQPDVIVSVHPTMNYAPMRSVQKLSKKYGMHIPFFTVVTDLATGHATWFQKNIDKIYVASERMRRLSIKRGRTPEDRIANIGLPIRKQFSVQASKLGDRTSAAGREYQECIKKSLGVDPHKPMVLLMGGGEGVGSLSKIVDQVYVALSKRGLDATLCVVCGRNEKLRTQLAQRDWQGVKNTLETAHEHKRLLGRVLRRRNKKVTVSKTINGSTDAADGVAIKADGDITVVGLGFITNMADYMTAADLILTKAGPGTIAEAAALGLPVLLTSFLPGQEAGNTDFVIDNGFGTYLTQPEEIGKQVADWLGNPTLLQHMSRQAQLIGHPNAASDIVKDIGSITHTWLALNRYGRLASGKSDDDEGTKLNGAT